MALLASMAGGGISACGGSVDGSTPSPSGSPDVPPGPGGDAPADAGLPEPGVAGSGGTAGTGGTGGPDAGDDAVPSAAPDADLGPECGRAGWQPSLSVKTWDGEVLECGTSTAPGNRLLQGVVVDSTPSSFVLESCHADAGCETRLSYFDGGGYVLFDLPLGAFVEVEVAASTLWTCQLKMVASNLPEWNGLQNPVSTLEHSWLVVSDSHSVLEEHGDMPFALATRRLHCYAPPNPFEGHCGEPEDDLVFEVTPNGGTQPISVGMGRTTSFQVPNDPGVYTFQNLASFDDVYCMAFPPEIFYRRAYAVARR